MVGFDHSRPHASGEINSLCPKVNGLVLNLHNDDVWRLQSPSTSLEWCVNLQLWLNSAWIILLPPSRAMAALFGVQQVAVWFYMRTGF